MGTACGSVGVVLTPGALPDGVAGQMRPQEVSEFLAWHALLEREGSGEFGRLERPNTLEAPGEVVHQRFSEQDVPDEQVDPRFRAPREGIEIWELCAEEVLDRVEDLSDPLLTSSP